MSLVLRKIKVKKSYNTNKLRFNNFVTIYLTLASYSHS